jgi:hypothetical protein
MAERFDINVFTGKFDKVIDPIEATAHADLSDMPDVAGTNSDHDARYLRAETDPLSLHLDQTTPQTITATDATITASDEIYYGDVTDSTKIKKDTVQGILDLVPAATDEKVKYDAGDTTAGYVADKVIAGTGISVAEGTGADENKLKITNSSPDQTVAIAAGTGISVSGTYPSFTVTNSSPAVPETDPVFAASDAADITSTDITNLGNLSGTNSGDQVGDGVTITGAGTVADPFVAVVGGGGGAGSGEIEDLGERTVGTCIHDMGASV